MKNILKILVLGAMSVGALVGCDDKKQSSQPASSEDITSSIITSSDSSSSAISSKNDSSTSVAPTLTGITLNTDNVKKTYEQGEAIDLTGLVVTAKYSDNSTAVVTDYIVAPANGTLLNQVGDIDVNVRVGTATASFKVKVTTLSKKDWTDAEAKIMSDHLYGVVLPYTGFEESIVFYDDNDDKVYVYGGAKNDTFLTTYYAKLAAADFIDFQSVPGLSISMEKEITTEAGPKHVYVYATFNNDQLYMEVYDPYYYTFPADFTKALVYDLFTSNEVVPAIDADFYSADENTMSVTCYYQSTLEDGGYSAVLSANNWDVQPDKDDGFYIAVSPNSAFQLAYKYADGKLKIYVEPLFFWNANLITNFYTKYQGTVINVPTLDVEGAQYQFVESKNNQAYYEAGYLEAIHSFMYIYGATANDLSAYATTLQTSGWKVENSNGFYYASLTILDKGIARLEAEYSETRGCIIITIYFNLDPIPQLEWPAEEIATLLGGYQEDVVPEFTETNNGFAILNDMFGTAIMIYVPHGLEEAAVDAYIELLVANKYTQLDEEEYGENHFISENEEIIVYVYKGTHGSITVDFQAAPMKKFPSAYINHVFVSKKDTVPALNGAKLYECSLVPADSTLIVKCLFESAAEAASAYSQYDATLTGANYTYGGERFGTKFYSSKNNEFSISLQLDEDNSAVLVNITGTLISEQSLWPADDIAALFEAKGFTDPLPVYEDHCTAISADTNYDGSIFVLLETEESGTVYGDYCDLLADEHFAYDYQESTYYDSVFKSPNNQYSVTVSENRFGVSLTLKALATQGGASEFPMAELLKDVPEAQGVLPIIEDANASFEYDYYFDEAFITVTYANEDAATTALNAYIAALQAANFTVQKLWGYLEAYVSPDQKIAVELDTYDIKDGSFKIGVLNSFTL